MIDDSFHLISPDVRRFDLGLEQEVDAPDRSRRTYLAQRRALPARQLSEVEASESGRSSPTAEGSAGQ